MNILFKNCTAEEIKEKFSAFGTEISSRLAMRIQGYIFKNDSFPSNLTETAPSLLSKINENAIYPNLTLLSKETSQTDMFAKYLFRGSDPEVFESVRIPVPTGKYPGYIICVSSQAGCSLGCAFCATGKLGFKRNLETWEIVDQVLKIKMDSDKPIKGIVFMGMGEPLLNVDNVLKAINIFTEPCGMAISSKAITVSTSGIPDGIRKFINYGKNCRLILSLTSAIPEKRKLVMPIEKIHPIQEILPLLKEYSLKRNERMTLAWTLISGFNTGENDALTLKNISEALPIKLDLIDVNDSSSRFSPPDDDERNQFIDYIRKHCDIPVSRRYSGGKDISASCGMLAGGTTDKGSEPKK
jgi:23S rRNA (adenine2503-C2)-methyltransferase